jgi:S-(hydroxymethyl)glutathione dehydrogenase/alcohol dehydrogenase
MKITAALLDAAHEPFRIEDVDLAPPGPGEVLVKVGAAGVCHSDWHLVTGATKHPMPVVAGHEGAGVVAEVGKGVTGVQAGDSVALNWAPACGRCFYCQHEKPNLCDAYTKPIWAGTMLDGTTRLSWRGRPVYHWCGLAAFATHAVVPVESVVKVKKDVPVEVAALVGCAVSTGVGAAMYTAGIRPGESVAIFGCGGVGLSVVQGAVLCGASTVIAIDTCATKENLARQMGATHFIAADGDVVDRVKGLTGGRGADCAFEAVGVPAVQERALEAVRPGGQLVLAGLSAMGTGTNLPGAVIVRQEKTIKGSYYGSVDARRDFPLFLDLYLAGKLKLDAMVSRRWRLDEINEAYQAMLSGDVARGVIVF